MPNQALISYFKKKLPELKNKYEWKITKKIDGFECGGKSDYCSNVALKNFFHQKWLGKTNRVDLAKSVIADWGGVRNNKDTTLNAYLVELSKESPATPLKGVASYSKLFAIAHPEKYAIYDARVAACLNAVQLNAGIRDGLAFNYIPGRNNVVGNAITRQGFVYKDSFKTNSLIQSGWKPIKRDDTYKIYLETLHTCLKQFPNYKLYDLEMILFANAEIECREAINRLTNS